MSEKTIPLKKKILVSQLERLLKEHNISCNAVKLIDTFNLSCIFELQTAIDVKQIAKIPVAIAYALNVDIDLIDIKLSGRYLYLTLPQPTAMIFSFSQICNKDLELRQDKAFNDYLLLPTGIKENGDIAYLDLSKNVHWSIIGASQQLSLIHI